MLAGQAQISRPDPPAQHDRPLLRRDRCQPLRQAHLARHELKVDLLLLRVTRGRLATTLVFLIRSARNRGARSGERRRNAIVVRYRNPYPSDDPGRSRAARGWARTWPGGAADPQLRPFRFGLRRLSLPIAVLVADRDVTACRGFA